MTFTKFIRASAVTVGALAVATQVNAADLYSGGGLKDAPVYAPAPLWTGFTSVLTLARIGLTSTSTV